MARLRRGCDGRGCFLDGRGCNVLKLLLRDKRIGLGRLLWPSHCRRSFWGC